MSERYVAQPLLASEIPDAWISAVRANIAQQSLLMKPGDDNTILLYSKALNEWQTLLFPNNGTMLANKEEQGKLMEALKSE